MNRFPALRDETDRIVSTHVREQESLTKDQVCNLVQFELAYINTNHDDFIGFANASAKGVDSGPKKRTVGNQVIRKGWLTLHNLSFFKGGSSEFWFTLSAENLSWYKDDEEKDKKYVLALDNIRLRDLEKGFMSSKVGFALFSTESRNVYKDHRQLEVSADSQEDIDAWKASFLRAGVYPERHSEKNQHEEEGKRSDDRPTLDPQLERQVETIRNLVDSYMAIVNKTIRDLVPKIIMNIMINQTKDFIKTEILAHLYASGGGAQLMEESPEEVERRDTLLKMYNSLKESLKVMGDINMKTVQTSLPPPVDNSWIPEEDASKNGYPAPQSHIQAPPRSHGRSTSPGRRPSARPPPARSAAPGPPPSHAPFSLPPPMTPSNYSAASNYAAQSNYSAPPIPSRPGGSVRAAPSIPRRPAPGQRPPLPQRPT